MKRTTKPLAVILLVVAIYGRAASAPAALFQHRGHQNPTTKPGTTKSVPHPVTFREVPGRGLLVRTWINGTGPFNFAIDTGAGATLLSPLVANEARVTRAGERAGSVAGLSGAMRSAYHASLQSLAIGEMENYLPGSRQVMITDGLPSDLDGVLDPTEALSPLGYSIDIPRHEFIAFDPNTEAVKVNRIAGEGTVVAWLRQGQEGRPFVMLDNGDRALLDTGSSLGLVVRDPNAARNSAHVARDVGGGQISTRRGSTSTISIGSLMLKRIPTDFVSGTEASAPVLLGLAALRPFRLRFDPVHRLIEISVSTGPRNN